MGEQLQTTWRELQAATDTFKQNNTQFLFEPIDLTTKSWLGHAQCPRRCRQRALFSRDQKRPCFIPVKFYRPPIHTNMHIKAQELVNSHSFACALNPVLHRAETISTQCKIKMTTLIVGASGAIGRLLVEELLNRGQEVRIVVRSLESLPETVIGHANLSIIEESILDMSNADMVSLVQGCHAVVSCLGHNLTFRGLFGWPRRLVTDATRGLCDAIRASQATAPVRFVLMNTAGNSNRDLDERISFG